MIKNIKKDNQLFEDLDENVILSETFEILTQIYDT